MAYEQQKKQLSFEVFTSTFQGVYSLKDIEKAYKKTIESYNISNYQLQEIINFIFQRANNTESAISFCDNLNIDFKKYENHCAEKIAIGFIHEYKDISKIKEWFEILNFAFSTKVKEKILVSILERYGQKIINQKDYKLIEVMKELEFPNKNLQLLSDKLLDGNKDKYGRTKTETIVSLLALSQEGIINVKEGVILKNITRLFLECYRERNAKMTNHLFYTFKETNTFKNVLLKNKVIKKGLMSGLNIDKDIADWIINNSDIKVFFEKNILASINVTKLDMVLPKEAKTKKIVM